MLKEAALQKDCVCYVRMQHRNALFIHVPNEGKRSPKYWNWLKSLGASEGFPDLVFFNRRGGYSGLAIEMKYGKNDVTNSQIVWLNALKAEGYRVEVCNSFEQFKTIVDGYFS